MCKCLSDREWAYSDVDKWLINVTAVIDNNLGHYGNCFVVGLRTSRVRFNSISKEKYFLKQSKNENFELWQTPLSCLKNVLRKIFTVKIRIIHSLRLTLIHPSWAHKRH